MPQQQHRLSAALPPEIHLQVISEILRAMEFCVPSQTLIPSSEHRTETVHGLFVVAGRFDLHQLADSLSNFILPLGEISQAFRHFADRCSRGAYFYNSRFFSHEAFLKSAAKDRKSTRLNSSHSSISYAVSCLK